MKAMYVIGLFILLGCSYPKDPENSYMEARSSSLKIGITPNPPFTDFNNGKAEGIEIDILRDFAHSRNLKIDFVEGSESELVERLKDYKLHILAGGFKKKTLWKREAGATVTYDKEHIFLIPKGENELLKELETFLFLNLKRS